MIGESNKETLIQKYAKWCAAHKGRTDAGDAGGKGLEVAKKESSSIQNINLSQIIPVKKSTGDRMLLEKNVNRKHTQGKGKTSRDVQESKETSGSGRGRQRKRKKSRDKNRQQRAMRAGHGVARHHPNFSLKKRLARVGGNPTLHNPGSRGRQRP